jgi:hypothetical protein
LGKGNIITTLATLNLIQSYENKEKLEELETKKEAEERYNALKFSMQKLGLKVIEFESSQGNHTEEIKEILEKGNQEKEKVEEERKQSKIKLLTSKDRTPVW